MFIYWYKYGVNHLVVWKKKLHRASWENASGLIYPFSLAVEFTRRKNPVCWRWLHMLTKKIVSVYLSASPLSASLPSNSIREEIISTIGNLGKKIHISNPRSYFQNSRAAEFRRIPSRCQILWKQESRVELFYCSPVKNMKCTGYFGPDYFFYAIISLSAVSLLRLSVKCLTSVPSKRASR